mmetsp:Transcript_76699/g.215672  ORF Transcript_76699/g.215672 Transcript_76699/m.215672 type:complete len:219 (-) Transcript_76699:863-1519(-)
MPPASSMPRRRRSTSASAFAICVPKKVVASARSPCQRSTLQSFGFAESRIGYRRLPGTNVRCTMTTSVQPTPLGLGSLCTRRKPRCSKERISWPMSREPPLPISCISNNNCDTEGSAAASCSQDWMTCHSDSSTSIFKTSMISWPKDFAMLDNVSTLPICSRPFWLESPSAWKCQPGLPSKIFLSSAFNVGSKMWTSQSGFSCNIADSKAVLPLEPKE